MEQLPNVLATDTDVSLAILSYQASRLQEQPHCGLSDGGIFYLGFRSMNFE